MITVKTTFGAVTVDGLLSAHDLAEMFADLYAADADVREALESAAAALRDLADDDGKCASEFASARLEKAIEGLASQVQVPAVELMPDDARHLRELLIKARLGQGRAEPSYRRSA